MREGHALMLYPAQRCFKFKKKNIYIYIYLIALIGLIMVPMIENKQVIMLNYICLVLFMS